MDEDEIRLAQLDGSHHRCFLIQCSHLPRKRLVRCNSVVLQFQCIMFQGKRHLWNTWKTRKRDSRQPTDGSEVGWWEKIGKQAQPLPTVVNFHMEPFGGKGGTTSVYWCYCFPLTDQWPEGGSRIPTGHVRKGLTLPEPMHSLQAQWDFGGQQSIKFSVNELSFSRKSFRKDHSSSSR